MPERTLDLPGAAATARFVRITPMKARRVIDLIRGRAAGEALAVLQFAPQAASEQVRKVLASAVANAENNERLDRSDLVVTEAYVDEGPTLKRFRPRAQGRAFRIRKRTSHITVVVSAQPQTAPAKKAAKSAKATKAAKTTRKRVLAPRRRKAQAAPPKKAAKASTAAKASKSAAATKTTKAAKTAKATKRAEPAKEPAKAAKKSAAKAADTEQRRAR